MDALIQAEGAFLLWIQEAVRSNFMTVFMTGITSLNYLGILWILITLALLAFRKTRRLGAMCAIAMIIGLVVTNGIIKNWVARVRPYDAIEGLTRLTDAQRDFSFPSGHTTNAMACSWVLLMRGPKRWGIPLFALAILIGLSRLYVGVHYPTDVLAGAAIGICSATLAIWLVPRIEKRFPKVKRLYEL